MKTCKKKTPKTCNSPVPTILEEAGRLTSTDRNQQYGHPADDYGTVCALWNTWWSHHLKHNPGAVMGPKECEVFMVIIKLARLAVSYKRDTMVDLCGYVRLIEMTEEKLGK